MKKMVQQLPEYVADYYLTKSSVPLSPATLYQYLNEFHRFFIWMIDTNLTQAKTVKQISLDDLATFKKTGYGVVQGLLVKPR
ncbi:hypothetical protein [Secundilactobacillus odoratitofui]|uniref:hypothetical protein n=1 Tax=Secundilactobacillus odoratitofui TaxID=480930 RepID=UPI0025AFF0B2|nr:hypothetical protein [Secundilactobacillus odoratitofui]